MKARYCSPNQGRFLSVDKVLEQPGNPQSWNRYLYAQGNPVNQDQILRGQTVKSEVLLPWHPVVDTPFRVEVVRLVDIDDGLQVMVRDQNCPIGPGLRLAFPNPIAYRCIDESYRLRTWSKQTSRTLPSLVTIDNSTWVNWLVGESLGVLPSGSLKHFAILTEDDCIDIVTLTQPEVEWMKNPAEECSAPEA